MKKLLLALAVCGILTAGCQQKPTKSIEETSNSIFKVQTVLVDTRTAFLFQSFHIPGSVNLVTSDFIILKDPRTKKYILDPDLNQTIERLARKGVSPDRHIVLLSTEKNSVENKKWNWLLRNLNFEDIEMSSVDEFNLKHKNARYAEPSRADVWTIKLSEPLQNEFVIKKGVSCFVGWSDKTCNINQ